MSDDLRARVITPNLTAQHLFHGLEGVADFRDLAALLAGLADDWRGWTGERAWWSADGDFGLVCTHDGLSQVRLVVSLRDWVDLWELQSLIVLVELGRLEGLRRDVERFFLAR